MMDRTITALVEHKFDMAELKPAILNETYYGPLTSFVHNNVNLSFRLLVQGKNSMEGYEDHIGLYICFVDGPARYLTIHYALLVAKGPGEQLVPILTLSESEFQTSMNNKGSAWGSAKMLANTLEGLRCQGYLLQDTTLLHAYAVLVIPEVYFDDPRKLCPAASAQNRVHHQLYLETDTSTATNWPSNRFEMISNDGHHLWVHKEVLTVNSDVFEQMFDPSKPEDARFDYFREGRMTLKNASGGALKEMITYLYLQHTTPDFDQFAMELVPLAEMYGLKGLVLLCHETLVVQAENRMDVDELLHFHEVAQLHKLSPLRIKSVKRLAEEVLKDQNDVDADVLLKVTEQAHKHGYEQLKTACQEQLLKHVNECKNVSVSSVLDLATESLKYGLNDLTLACARWVNRDWQTVGKDGDLSDIFGEIFARLMTLAEEAQLNKNK